MTSVAIQVLPSAENDQEPCSDPQHRASHER